MLNILSKWLQTPSLHLRGCKMNVISQTLENPSLSQLSSTQILFPAFFFRIPIWNISCFQYLSDPNKFEQNYTNDSVGVWKWKRKFFVYKSITCKFWSEMEKKDKDGKWLKLVTSTINVKISEWKSFFKWERKISRKKKHNKLFFFSQLFVLAEDKFLGNSFTK